MLTMAKLKHVLVIPFPAQGHVTPLLKLSHCIADYGAKVTFVNTESIHAQVMAANPGLEVGSDRIKFVAIPDGLETDEERKDSTKMMASILRVMPGHLQELVEKVKKQSNGNEDEQISFMIADLTAGWALEVAERMGIERAGFWPASVSTLALVLNVPHLIKGGVIDNNGIALKNDLTVISKDIPPYKSNDSTWNCPEDPIMQKVFFQCISAIPLYSKRSNSFICNSFHELEEPAISVIPGALPIGPLIASAQLSHLRGSPWNEDSTCSKWLDQHPTQSVIYVAFGSMTIFSLEQFYELAHGLEQIGRPFLWVVRPDLTDGSVTEFHDGFLQRVRNYGKVVQWAPQEEVLAHSAVACFFTHCGWNSTMEAPSNGVPLLCRPYFGDQFPDRSFICDVWRVGLGVDADENGVTTRHEVRKKMLAVLGSEEIRANCPRVKEMARKSVSEGGSSLKHLQSFYDSLRVLVVPVQSLRLYYVVMFYKIMYSQSV
ncbi:UDP-glycosyltransferase 83A1-like [Rhodamnia argentea]|uniref:UDP-glycosyltransferase 83A1-like n=1 Tax=Rhodamnia argentea TaxID=178133 RepID=A0ABM3HPS7_9MYRT|nr:UDP-glycosyltransferase 83A1-like [Rhodamnia argentea]